jgi:hypothetical protein
VKPTGSVTVQYCTNVITGLQNLCVIAYLVSVVLLYYSLFIVFLHQDITDSLTRVTQVGGEGHPDNIVFQDVNLMLHMDFVLVLMKKSLLLIQIIIE